MYFFFTDSDLLAPLPEENKNTIATEWWDTMMFCITRVWFGLARRLRFRKKGLMKLHHDVKTCEYEDVRVMWEMLKIADSELTRTPDRRIKKRHFWNITEWPKRAPYSCGSYSDRTFSMCADDCAIKI